MFLVRLVYKMTSARNILCCEWVNLFVCSFFKLFCSLHVIFDILIFQWEQLLMMNCGVSGKKWIVWKRHWPCNQHMCKPCQEWVIWAARRRACLMGYPNHQVIQYRGWQVCLAEMQELLQKSRLEETDCLPHWWVLLIHFVFFFFSSSSSSPPPPAAASPSSSSFFFFSSSFILFDVKGDTLF